MAVTVRELREFLDMFDGDRMVGVDEGGLCVVVLDADFQPLKPLGELEICGIPDEDENENRED